MRSPISALESSPYDVAIIGAGINGCSAAQHLAAAGYSVLLLDKGDFGGGATSRSGRVLHCGLQLLAPKNGPSEFIRHPADFAMRLRVARQTAKDHAELCETMADRLEAMDIAVPIYRGAGYAGWQVDLAVKLIGRLGNGESSVGYRRWKPPSRSPHPFVRALRDQGAMTSAIAFVDQRFEWPERMAIDAALDAERMGAAIRNFTRVGGLSRGSDGLWRLDIEDCIVPGDRERVSARIVLNLAGAWVDRVLAMGTDAPPVARKITAVKGVYMLVRLPADYRGAGVAGFNRVGEPICCLPWRDLHYIGPTETLFEGDLDDVLPDEEDLRFLIDEFTHLAPGIPLTRDDLVMAWAGARPITHAPGYPKGKRLPFNVLHDLGAEGLPNIFALTWGIIVHHRSTARRIVDAVSARVAPSREERAISYDARHFPPSSSPPLQDGQPITLDDLRFCVEHEHAQDLAGVLFRRTGIAWSASLSRRSIDVAARTTGDALGWNQALIEDEASRFIEYMRRNHCCGID